MLYKKTNLLVLVTGVDKNKHNFHAYIAVPTFKLKVFRERVKYGNYSLSDFGQILYVDKGLIPKKGLAEDLMIKYGYECNMSEIVNDMFNLYRL